MRSTTLLLFFLFSYALAGIDPPPATCLQGLEYYAFGGATPFNLFVGSTLEACNSDVEGAVAAGGPVTLSSYTIGKAITDWYPYEFTLQSGGDVTWTNGGIHNGGIIGTTVSGIQNVEILLTNGTRYESNTCCLLNSCHACTAGPTILDFEGIMDDLYDISFFLVLFGYLSGLSGAVVDRNGNIDIYCPEGQLFNPFIITVTPSHRSLHIHCAAGQIVIINYTPDTAGYPPGFGTVLTGGVTPCLILHNFFNYPGSGAGPNLRFTSEIIGSLLAPFSNLDFPYGQITGNVMVGSFVGTSGCNGVQINRDHFCGCFPDLNPDVRYCCSYDVPGETKTSCGILPCEYLNVQPPWSFANEEVLTNCGDCCYSSGAPV